MSCSLLTSTEICQTTEEGLGREKRNVEDHAWWFWPESESLLRRAPGRWHYDSDAERLLSVPTMESRIARELNQEGVATKRGGRWHASTVRGIVQRRDWYAEHLNGS
jgi:hypothetical protein